MLGSLSQPLPDKVATIPYEPSHLFDSNLEKMLYWTKTCENPNEIVYFKIPKVIVERYFDTVTVGTLHENNTIDQWKFYGQGGPGQADQIYYINGSLVRIDEYG